MTPCISTNSIHGFINNNNSSIHKDFIQCLIILTMTNTKHLATYDHAPYYMRTPYIQGMYHVGPYKSVWKCMWNSLTFFHTETINAYTMILVSIASSYHLYNIAPCKNTAHISLWLSAILHCPFSIIFHTLMPMGESFNNVCRLLDQLFIVIGANLVCFSMSVYLPWYVRLVLQIVMFQISYACASCIFMHGDWANNLNEFMGKLKLLVMIYTFPVLITNVQKGLLLSLTLGSSAVVMMIRFPECIFKRRMLLTSHELMHVGIIIAHFIEYDFITASCIDST